MPSFSFFYFFFFYSIDLHVLIYYSAILFRLYVHRVTRKFHIYIQAKLVLLYCLLQPCIYFAEQDQPACTCSLILIYILCRYIFEICQDCTYTGLLVSFIFIILQPIIYVADHDQPACTCSLILLYILCRSIVDTCQRKNSNGFERDGLFV